MMPITIICDDYTIIEAYPDGKGGMVAEIINPTFVLDTSKGV